MNHWKRLLQHVHQDERGAVSLETILIIGMIALPVLIFLKWVAWPKFQEWYEKGVNDLENGTSSSTTTP